MKKIAVSLVSVLAVVVLCFSLAGCSASGTYKFESLTVGVGSLSTTFEVGKEYNEKKLEAGSIRLVLNKDGSCTFKPLDSDTEISGTWEEKDDGKIDFSGIGISNAIRDGSRITFDFGVMKITLKK